MNYLLEQMPQAVLINGEAVPINTDFRVCLRIIQALEDERLMAVLLICFPKMVL